MNIDMRKVKEKQFREHISEIMETTRLILEIMVLKTLHENFGFGKKRLKEYGGALSENYGGLSREMHLTDTYRDKAATNLDTAVIRAVMALRRDGIDYRDILGCDGRLLFVERDGKRFNVDEFVDKELEREKNGWKRSGGNGSE